MSAEISKDRVSLRSLRGKEEGLMRNLEFRKRVMKISLKKGPKYLNIYINLIRLLEVWSFSLFYQFKLLYMWKFWTAAIFSLTTQFMLTILNLEAR